MTLEQLMSWCGNMPIEEYEELLVQIEQKEKALARACTTAYDEEDSLVVLEGEQGSECWRRHERRHQNALSRAEKLRAEIQSLKDALNAGSEKKK